MDYCAHDLVTAANGCASCRRCGLVLTAGELGGHYPTPPCKTKAPVSKGLLAATQRRDVSRFRVCRGVLTNALPCLEPCGIDVPCRASVRMVPNEGPAVLVVADDLAEVTIVLPPNRSDGKHERRTEHLEPPSSRTVTVGGIPQ